MNSYKQKNGYDKSNKNSSSESIWGRAVTSNSKWPDKVK